MDFGNKLKELREESCLTQKQMAEILGVAKSNISKYESNTIEPSMDTLKKISTHFGISLDILLGTEDLTESKNLNINQKDIPTITVGKQLKQLRNELGKSQIEVCEALHIEQSTLANYENEKRIPKIDILIKIASYYNVSVDYLLGNDVPKETSAKPNKETSNIGKQEEHITDKKSYYKE